MIAIKPTGHKNKKHIIYVDKTYQWVRLAGFQILREASLVNMNATLDNISSFCIETK